MITPAQAKKLRTLITKRCQAEREEAFAGSHGPDEADSLRLELENAKLTLDKLITEITENN